MVDTFMFDKGPYCRDDQRRADIMDHPLLNGIDFVEYEYREADPYPHVLTVRFLKPLPDPPHSDPDGAFGLVDNPSLVRVHGGKRIVDIRVLKVSSATPGIEIAVDKSGDFSTYYLSLGWTLDPSGNWLHSIDCLDKRFSVAPIYFKAGCPTPFDCRIETLCSTPLLKAPILDYLTKDYAGFRELFWNLLSERHPDWVERNAADLGTALVELLAYAGDHLSYFQDAVANEAFLETARKRISAKRHARMVDYGMHDGRNAWTEVYFQVSSNGTIPRGTKVITKIGDPLQGELTPPSTVIREVDLDDTSFEEDPAFVRSRIFETAADLDVYPENNTLYIHTYGDKECCLQKGTQSCAMYALDPLNPTQAIRPVLKVGDMIIFEEIIGPETGAKADADPTRRQGVRLVRVTDDEDPMYRDTLVSDGLAVRTNSAWSSLPLVRVEWKEQDALAFPLCISAKKRDGEYLPAVSCARGNCVLADHGRTLTEIHAQDPPVASDSAFRLYLNKGPLTLQCAPKDADFDTATGRMSTNRVELRCDPEDASPAISLIASFPTGDVLYTPVPNLLDSPSFARHFVADVDDDGRGILRFGDGTYGMEAAGAESITAVYRVGNARDGNIGAEALSHAVEPIVAASWPTLENVRNPIAARDGQDAETIEEVRQKAPAAFLATQYRAVTEADYQKAVLEMPEVAGAAAEFRWTGSWHTVLLGIDPKDPRLLISEQGGRTRLDAALVDRISTFIAGRRLAGYDLEIRSAEYVSLDIEILLCVAPDHFRGHVQKAVYDALSSGIRADGTPGFFHPDNFTFGDPVYLSALYAAIEAVDGVESATVRRFQIFGETDKGELDAGVILIGPWQIARLENDPNYKENGVLTLLAGGGK